MASIRGSQITEIRSDYVSSRQTMELRKRKRRRKLFLRLIVFAVFMGSFTTGFMGIYHNQNVSLEEKQVEKGKLDQKLAQLKKKNQALNIEVKRLHDKEYVGELARKELLLSKPNETIFTTPNTDKH